MSLPPSYKLINSIIYPTFWNANLHMWKQRINVHYHQAIIMIMRWYKAWKAITTLLSGALLQPECICPIISASLSFQDMKYTINCFLPPPQLMAHYCHHTTTHYCHQSPQHPPPPPKKKPKHVCAAGHHPTPSPNWSYPIVLQCHCLSHPPSTTRVLVLPKYYPLPPKPKPNGWCRQLIVFLTCEHWPVSQ